MAARQPDIADQDIPRDELLAGEPRPGTKFTRLVAGGQGSECHAPAVARVHASRLGLPGKRDGDLVCLGTLAPHRHRLVALQHEVIAQQRGKGKRRPFDRFPGTRSGQRREQQGGD